MDRKKSLCFSGHRMERLPQSTKQITKMQSELNEIIVMAVENGIDTFYFGACYGFDLYCARLVLMQKKLIKMNDIKQIKLIAVVPYEEQANNWDEANRELYFDTLAQCDGLITLHTRFKIGCYHESDRYMVDHSSKLICYYDGGTGGTAYTVTYAKKNNLQIINVYEETNVL